MENELSERFRQAADFLQANGYAKNDSAIAKKLGICKSTLCMALNGTRVPSWNMLLDFCDAYPVNFWWLRSGKGSIVRSDDEILLLKRIEELEQKLTEQKGH